MAKPKKKSGGGPSKEAKSLAQEYGFAYAFLKSSPEIYSLFKKAVSGTWTADKFAAELKSTKWYQKHSESQRQWALLKTSDPATAKQREAALRGQVADAAAQMGASLNGHQLSQVVKHALEGNWNDAQIRDLLSSHVRAVNGVYQGDTGEAIDQVAATAWKNGIALSSKTKQRYAEQLAAGNFDAAYLQQNIRNMAKQFAPNYADQLDAGLDLQDIANPYLESMAKTLELNPADIDLFDPTIRGALSSKDKDGKPSSMSLWMFEQSLRTDPRWLKTKNAQDQLNAVGAKVLSDFGFKPGG